MTIRPKRRGRRSLAAILAAMLMASVLAVVAGTPAQAANTSGEELIDTDGDGIPDAREFAGAHRYITAVNLAERFADDEGSITTAIVASGETEVDAVTASGLAGNLNAPVLLVRSSFLPHNVARFINEHNITEVKVVGGPASVSDKVMDDIRALGSKPTVKRIAGADRYETAAAIGSALGGPNPTWCGSTQTAAILVNGGDAGRADAIVAGPLAFRLGLPVLLTTADEVPEATAAFLTANKVERVMIVGGEAAVSEAVRSALVEEIGAVIAPRVSGATAAATSVAVAKEMLGKCADVLQTDRDRVALVNRDAVADGIAAAPVLGRGLGAGGSVPILLVGDELPAAVSDYLSGTAEVRSGMKTHQSILAIGGTAVVSDSVMADAVAAAKTSSELTAEITAKLSPATGKYQVWTYDHDNDGTTPEVVGGGVFTVTFSDDVKLPVDGTDADTIAGSSDAERRNTVLDPRLYQINGRRIEALHTVDPRFAPPPTGTDQELVGYSDLVFTADRTIKIYLSHILQEGDTISVVGGSKVGANSDMRPLQPAQLKLGPENPPVDGAAPVVEIIAVPGQSSFDIIVHEPNVLANSNDLASGTATVVSAAVKVAGKAIPASNNGTPDDTTDDTVSTPRVITIAKEGTDPSVGRKTAGSKRYTYNVTGAAGTVPTGKTPATVDNNLRVGDVITVARNSVRDKGGRGNALTQFTVPKVKTNLTSTTSLEVEKVSIGNYQHHAQASVQILNSNLKVTAKADGKASGARGNSWVIFGYDDRVETTRDTLAFDIRVAVDIDNQRISYTIADAAPKRPGVAPTLGDLAAAMVRNGDFIANFAVSYNTEGADTKLTGLGTTGAAGQTLTGGLSRVGVVVEFNAAINTLAGTTVNTGGGDDLARDIAPAMPATLATGDAMVVTFENPDTEVHISYTSATMTKLPTRAGFRVIEADVATGYGNSTVTPAVTAVSNVREILSSLVPDASIKP